MVMGRGCNVDNQPGIPIAFGSRVPDLNGKNCVLFKFSILSNFYRPCPSLLWFYSEFLTLKSPLDRQSHCSVKIRTFTHWNPVLWSQAQPERGARVADSRVWGDPRSLTHGRPARLLRAEGETSRWDSGAGGWVPFVLPRLCSTEMSHDMSGWKHLCPLLLGRKTWMWPVMGWTN